MRKSQRHLATLLTMLLACACSSPLRQPQRSLQATPESDWGGPDAAEARNSERAALPVDELLDGGTPKAARKGDIGMSNPGVAGDGRDNTGTPDPHQDEVYRQPLPNPLIRTTDSAFRYANLFPWQCRKELARRKLPLKRQRETKGIATSLRFTAPMNGVNFLTAGPKSQYSLLDCRLALTLDDMTKVWNNHGVISIRVDNFYRSYARLPGSRKRSQHAYGLAMDVTEIGLADGRVLDVETAWSAELGVPPCGPDARVSEDSPDGLTLRNLLCLVAAGGHFHHILTPAYDLAHRDHLHLDIKRGAKYGIIR